MEEEATQVGGKLLGYGAYGCVFMPPLLCKGERRPLGQTVVSKIGVSEDLIKDLKKLNYIAENIPEADKYFIVSKDRQLCQPAERQIENPKEIEECYRGSDKLSSYTMTSLKMYRMNYGGQELDNRLSIGPSLNIWNFGKHILEGLTLLMVHGVVHADLHTSNIVVDNRGTPRAIDFGSALFIRNESDIKLPQLERLMHRNFGSIEDISRYYQEPPEVPLFNGFFKHLDTRTVMEGVFRYRPKLLVNLQALLGISKATVMNQVENYRKNTRFFERDPDLIQWFKHHWHTYDAWSIGYILMGIMVDLSRMGVDLDRHPKINKMKRALRGLLNFNCIERFNAARALAEWDSPANPIIVKYAKKWI